MKIKHINVNNSITINDKNNGIYSYTIKAYKDKLTLLLFCNKALFCNKSNKSNKEVKVKIDLGGLYNENGKYKTLNFLKGYIIKHFSLFNKHYYKIIIK